MIFQQTKWNNERMATIILKGLQYGCCTLHLSDSRNFHKNAVFMQFIFIETDVLFQRMNQQSNIRETL